MKILKMSLSLMALLFINHSKACEQLIETANSEAMTFSQAEQAFSEFLQGTEATLLLSDSTPAQIIDSIDCYLQRQSADYPGLVPARAALREFGDAVIHAATDLQRQAVIEGINRAVNRDAGSGYLQLPVDANTTMEFDLYQEFLAPACGPVAAPSCSDAVEVAMHLWWISGYYRSLAHHFNSTDIETSLAYTERLNRQWRSYKDDTILLWPQEVILNSIIYKSSEHGLSAPPAYKLLSLRPALGLTYLSDQRHRFQPTINIDLIGVYWWRYGGADGATAQIGRGIAASLVWDGSDTAVGLTYHHNPQWSATIAHGNDNDFVLSLSFQLAAWFLKN